MSDNVHYVRSALVPKYHQESAGQRDPEAARNEYAEVAVTMMSALRKTGLRSFCSCPDAPVSIDIQAGTWASAQPLRHPSF
jgi:hypothetical protein